VSALKALSEVRRLEVRFEELTVGLLRWHERALYFSYDEDFLARGLWLSPFHLPLKQGLMKHQDLSFGPLFGLFEDSLPDGWGRLLMSRHFQQQGLNLRATTPLAPLAYLGDKTMGALSYHPPRGDAEAQEALELSSLARHAQEVLSGAVTEVLPELQRAGGSPGGARPKVLVGVRREGSEGPELISGEGALPASHSPWLVKFRGLEDDQDAPRVELAYMELARLAGLDVPQTRAFEAEGELFFGVERFDRRWDGERWRRAHVHTLGGLLQADFRVPSSDYEDLFKVTRALTRNNTEALYQALRLMAFNWLSHNRDDHVKNVSFLMEPTGEWRLAPVYDLTWSAGPGGEHSMTIAGEGRAPQRSHLLMLCERFDLHARRCEQVIEEVATAVAQWERVAASFDVSAATRSRVLKDLQRCAR
jgi:serine/threonine-protein kinase HipA